VQRDRGEVNVRQSDSLAFPADRGAGVPVVEDVVGEVGVDGGCVFLRDGADEDGVTVEELQVDSEGIRVLGVEVEEWLQERFTSLALPIERGVKVVQETVADVDDLAGCLCYRIPAIELLVDTAQLIVITVERREGSESSPSRTQALGRVVAEAAYVGSNHGYLENGCKRKHLGNGDAVFFPLAEVISQPAHVLEISSAEYRKCIWVMNI